MIQLDYRLSPIWNRRVNEVDLGEVDELALRYDLFLGDVVFNIDGQDFSAAWDWVPVLDFAASLASITGQLERGASEVVFEFTESEAALLFRRDGSCVLISSNYSSGSAKTELSDFRAAVEGFRGKIARDQTQKYPELAKNEAFVTLMLSKPHEGGSPEGKRSRE